MNLTEFYNNCFKGDIDEGIIDRAKNEITSVEFKNKLISDLHKIIKVQEELCDYLYWVQFVIPKKSLKNLKFDIENEMNDYDLDTFLKLIDCGYDLPISYKYSNECVLILNDDFDYTVFDTDKYKPIQDMIKFRMVLERYHEQSIDDDDKPKLVDFIIDLLFNKQTPNYMVDWALLTYPEIVSKEVLETMFVKRHLISDRVKKRIVKMSKHFDFHLTVIYSVIVGTKMDLPNCVDYSHKYIIDKKFNKQLKKMYDNNVVEQYYKNIITKEIHNIPMTESMFDSLFLNEMTLVYCIDDFQTRPLDSLINIEHYKEEQLFRLIQHNNDLDDYVDDGFLESKILKKFNKFTNLRTRYLPESTDLV